jgi:hypothetical protein
METNRIVYKGNRFLIHVAPTIEKKCTEMSVKIAIFSGQVRIFCQKAQ